MNRTLRFRILFIALASCLLGIWWSSDVSAGTLSGRILDQNSNSPLAGATVRIQSPHEPALSFVVAADHEGWFQIADIPAGEYKIQVSAVGFTPQTIDDITVPESEPKKLDITLLPSSINLRAVSVTASRRPEKILDAPAAVSVVESETIETRTALTPTEHVKGLPGVDVATTGLNQSTMVVRGFNNVFSGALLVLTDNRIARVPSLRFNAYNFIPTISEDIDRVEIVSGPGSALYGPNAASGVLHIISKSPFADPGTTVSIGGGERDLFLGSFRHAGTLNDRIGYKVTGQYYQGHDWESHEPFEPDTIQKFRPTASGPVPIGDSIPNVRDFDIEKIAGEARIDFLVSNDATLTLNGGFNRATNIELTGLGAAQGIDWTYSFAQARLRYKDLFVQGYVNMSDAGDTYLLPTGQLIIDNSKFWALQAQHQYSPIDDVSLTYGVDALLTRPDTDSTINGRNEDKDDIDEIGGYLQSEFSLTEQVTLIGALRIDDHNKLEDLVISPRGALVYQPHADHNFRFTYNRAFSTPDNNNLYLDLLQTDDLGGIGAMLENTLGFSPEIDIRVQGIPESGLHWNFDENGPQYRSPFAPLLDQTPNDYFSFNDPLMTNAVWNIGRGAVMREIDSTLDYYVQNTPLTRETADTMLSYINAITPTTVQGVSNILQTLDPDDQDFHPSSASDIADIERLKPTITQTLELGYKGVLGDRVQFSVDLYRTQKDDFIGYLTVETPNVFLDPQSLSQYLASAIQDSLDANSTYYDSLALIDNPAVPGSIGDGDGTVADELSTFFTAGSASLPFGTVTPMEALDPTAVLVTYRNFGDISYYGADLAAAFHAHRNWNIGAAYSYISKNFFEKSADQVHDIYLNSPRHKARLSLQYINRQWGLEAMTRYRFVDAFDMDSPFYGNSVAAYHLVDLTAAVDFVYDTRFVLTVQNILDNRHIEFVGGPEIGRLIIARLTKTF